MDEEEDTFTNDDDVSDFEGEGGQRKIYETESETESEIELENSSKNQEHVDVIEKLRSEIDDLTTSLEQGEITFEKYNEYLIEKQMKIADEQIKLINSKENSKNSKDLVSELDSLFSKLTKQKKTAKFDPVMVGGTVDDIFRKYGEALEKELQEEDEFFFESNPITSNIGNIVNAETPEKYQKQLQMFEEKIVTNNVSIEDIYSYLDLRFNILNDNLITYLKNDILYLQFHMDLQMEFASLRSELELLIGETSVTIDEDIGDFNKKHNIRVGVLKSRKELLSNILVLKSILEDKIAKLIKKYDSAQETLFKKKDSKEVLKVFKQLREIYTKNQFLKLERRFVDEEIISDFKNQSLEFIIEKYSQYVVSEYFEWAAGKKEEKYERPKFVKRNKLSNKEKSLISETEEKEYYQRKQFEKILSTLPKEVLLRCADKLISEGKMVEPYYELTLQERYINGLYQKSIPIWIFSKNYNNNIKEYANEIDKLTDEFLINREVLKTGWNLGDKPEIGDLVYVDRTNGFIRNTMNEIENVQNKIEKINGAIEDIKSTENVEVNKLLHKLIQLKLKLKSYNKYMRAPQIKGYVVGINNDNNTIDVKMENASRIVSFPKNYISSYLKAKKDIPLYIVADSDAFNPTSRIKESSLLAINKWISVILGTTGQTKEELNKLYDKALEVYKSETEDKRAEIDKKVESGLSSRHRNEFINGVPTKGPILFVYPPILPEHPENEKQEVNLEEFYDYSKQLKEYTENLTPETNPFVKIGVPVTNQLINRINDKMYPSLDQAIIHTPINGFFKLSSITDFTSLVLNYLNNTEKKQLQGSLLSLDQIKEFYEVFYLNTDDDDKREIMYQYKPITSPKITLVNSLKMITDSEEYKKVVEQIDKNIKIYKIVGEEIFIDGRTAPITKISLEKMIMVSLEREYQARSETPLVIKQTDPLISSIEWGLSFNPTFQLLDLSKKLRGSYIVHGPNIKFRIRIIDHNGRFYSGWTINPVKEITNKQLVYKYNFPLIITDFTEFLKLYRNNQIIKYESFKQLDILNYEEFTTSNYILRQIEYISKYLKDIGEENEFSIEKIRQDDANLQIRQRQRKDLFKALTFMSNGSIDSENLQKIANDIEMQVFNSFEDIRKGTGGTVVTSNILESTDFETIKKFKSSAIPKTYISTLLYNTKSDYASYIIKISITIFNIYRTNDFIQNYINGTVSIESVTDRELTTDEMNEKSDTVDSLLKWSPISDVLKQMRSSNQEIFDKIILNGPEIADMSMIIRFEQETKKKLSFLNKKLALIELIRLRSWENTLILVKDVEESKKLKFLIKHRNALRSYNNITSKTRLGVLHNIYVKILNCKIVSGDLINEYAENIENACYSLSNTLSEYTTISNNILSSSIKLCKMISEFYRTGSGPVDILSNIAELYLKFGKTSNGGKVINKAKLGDWDGIKAFPTDLLSGLKKIANSMYEAGDKIRKENAYIKNHPELGIKEYKVSKDSSGNFIVKQIDMPNDTFGNIVQKLIDKNVITEEITNDLSSRENINAKDIQKLKSMSYEQLLEIWGNFYREPSFINTVPLSMAKQGILVYPIKTRGGFLFGGNFPLNAKAYRYRDSKGIIKTRLVEICKWIGIGLKLGEVVYPSMIKSIFLQDVLNFEEMMLNCVKKLLETGIWVKIYNNNLVNLKDVLSKVITEFGMYKSIEESVIKYFNKHGGNKSLFPNGGTKEEYDSFISNSLYLESMMKLLGVGTLDPPKIAKVPQIIVDDMIDVSILRNGDQEIYRKLYHSKTQTYPVPISYNSENYPIYSKKQKAQLAFLIDTGDLNPWYKNKIKIIKTKDDINFEGDLPFIIDETSDSWIESHHYVEQIFKDPMYGLPIVTRIGIIPKRIEGVHGQNIIKRIQIPKTIYDIDEEPFKIKFFKSEVPTQSQITEFRMSEAQGPISLTTRSVGKKSGYSAIDSRMLSYSAKYKPDDVWTWNPLKDYKVGAEKDNDIWLAEKNKQIAILKEWLRKAGSSSSAFIAAKNEGTRSLQIFRLNLPSQKRNEFTQTKFKKPAKSDIEIKLLNIGKTWKKLNKEGLIKEAKRIDFYIEQMKTSKPSEILSLMKTKLEAEIKINVRSIIDKIGFAAEEVDYVKINKMYAQIKEEIDYTYYIEHFIKHEFISISPEVMEVIKNPKKLFTNYNRFGIMFQENGNVEFVPKYSNLIEEDKFTMETIYEIIKNMSYTTNFGFSKHIIEYINNMELFDKLPGEDKLKLMANFPVMKIIMKIIKKGLKITIWNLLTTAYDTWYPVMYKGMKLETVQEIKKLTLKYTFENPIEITMEDVVNYLGDSYYQNAKYKKGVKYEMQGNNYSGIILYLHPGCKFEKINHDEVAFTDKTSKIAKYTHNPYITLIRNPEDNDPKISIEVLVVGSDLHNHNTVVSTNLSRRSALIYNVDMTDVEPCFSISDPNISGKFRDIAINDQDLLKFLAKGGNYYTILEMPDTELKFRKLRTGDKMTCIKTYRSAVKEYFKSKNKKLTYRDFVLRKRLNPLTLDIYINKVIDAKIPQNQLSHYIDALNILPDFLDHTWPSKKIKLDNKFIQNTQISLNNFLSGEKRDIYINVLKPTKLLYKTS
jgi:hypothetical protein